MFSSRENTKMKHFLRIAWLRVCRQRLALEVGTAFLLMGTPPWGIANSYNAYASSPSFQKSDSGAAVDP